MTENGSWTCEIDPYNGLHVKLNSQVGYEEFQLFVKKQEDSEKYRSIWIYLQTAHLSLLDILTNKLNYSIHHGLGKEIIVYKWLRKEEDLVVPYSMFWVAAGALVIKDDKVLLVEEKSGKRKGKYGLPGGRANKGELIAQCAERQLFEETGIMAKFQKIVFFRELTGQIYNCVDIYFVCLMTLTEDSLQGFKLCEREISNYKWVDLKDYEEFCQTHSFGTQLLTSRHVSRLYKEGNLFSNAHYEPYLDLSKGLCEHRL